MIDNKHQLNTPLKAFWFLSKTMQCLLRERRDRWEGFAPEKKPTDLIIDAGHMNDGDVSERAEKVESRDVTNKKLDWLLFTNSSTKLDFRVAYQYSRMIDSKYLCTRAYPWDSAHCVEKLIGNPNFDQFGGEFVKVIPHDCKFGDCYRCRRNWTEADLHFVLKSVGMMISSWSLYNAKNTSTRVMVIISLLKLSISHFFFWNNNFIYLRRYELII